MDKLHVSITRKSLNITGLYTCVVTNGYTTKTADTIVKPPLRVSTPAVIGKYMYTKENHLLIEHYRHHSITNSDIFKLFIYMKIIELSVKKV